MNPRLIKRLDLLAGISETKLRDDIARLTATLADLGQQRATLGRYQSRLTASWTSGETTQAASAQRAEIFCTAARTADTQITAREAQLRSTLQTALQNLAEVKQRRKTLENFKT